MIHDLDLVLTMVNVAACAPSRRWACPCSPRRSTSPTRGIRFANGCIANVTASRVSLQRERKLRIFQADAYFSIDFDERRGRVVRREPDAGGHALARLRGARGP